MPLMDHVCNYITYVADRHTVIVAALQGATLNEMVLPYANSFYTRLKLDITN